MVNAGIRDAGGVHRNRASWAQVGLLGCRAIPSYPSLLFNASRKGSSREGGHSAFIEGVSSREAMLVSLSSLHGPAFQKITLRVVRSVGVMGLLGSKLTVSEIRRLGGGRSGSVLQVGLGGTVVTSLYY